MFSARSEATIAECGYCSYAGDIQTPTEIEELWRISWNRKGVLCPSTNPNTIMPRHN